MRSIFVGAVILVLCCVGCGSKELSRSEAKRLIQAKVVEAIQDATKNLAETSKDIPANAQYRDELIAAAKKSADTVVVTGLQKSDQATEEIEYTINGEPFVITAKLYDDGWRIVNRSDRRR